MFVQTKKRALPLQIPSVRRSRPNIKAKRTNQFLDNPTEEVHLEDDVSSDDNDDSDSLPQTEDDSNDNDILPQIEDNNDNNDPLPQTEDDDNNNNDGSLSQTIEDEPNAYFEPIQGEHGSYFSNFTEQMLFFWTTKHMISNYQCF